MQHTARDPEGTMAYVTTPGSLFLKVSQGWKEIQVLIYLGLRQFQTAPKQRFHHDCITIKYLICTLITLIAFLLIFGFLHA